MLGENPEHRPSLAGSEGMLDMADRAEQEISPLVVAGADAGMVVEEAGEAMGEAVELEGR